MDRFYKKVLLPIQVCTGDYCWDGHRKICEHFDNDYANPYCELRIADLKIDEEGRYPKPKGCLSLKDNK